LRSTIEATASHERVIGVQAQPLEVAAIYEVTPDGIAKVWFVGSE